MKKKIFQELPLFRSGSKLYYSSKDAYKCSKKMKITNQNLARAPPIQKYYFCSQIWSLPEKWYCRIWRMEIKIWPGLCLFWPSKLIFLQGLYQCLVGIKIFPSKIAKKNPKVKNPKSKNSKIENPKSKRWWRMKGLLKVNGLLEGLLGSE